MKKRIIALLIGIFSFQAFNSYAQEVGTFLDDAREAYKAGNLDEARFLLQQAVNAVDLALAKEVLSILPTQLDDMQIDQEDETAGSASMGFAGLFVSRTYRADDEKSANLQIVADSPLLAGINAMLAIPMIGNNPDNKRIRLEGYKGILNRTQGDTGEIYYDLQVPFGSSLMTINFQGVSDEKQVIRMAESIEIEKIANLLK